MGVSTDAILFWGYCLDGDGVYPWNAEADDDGDEADADLDPEERYALAVGVKPPIAEWNDKDEKIKADYHRFWDEKRKAAAKSRCTVGYHCSDECSMYYVAIKKSETKAHRGYPKNIKSLEVGDDWEQKLRAYCEVMGIKTRQKPKWWLVSYWG